MSTDTIETTHVPGPEERKALAHMHGIERPAVNVVRHLIMHQVTPQTWGLLKWSAGRNAWIDGSEGQTFIRSVAVDRLANALETGIVTNVTLTDDRPIIDGLDPLQGWGLADFDRELLDPERTVLCPEGVPNSGPHGGWVRISVDDKGRGYGIADPNRFAGAMVAAEFRSIANYGRDVD